MFGSNSKTPFGTGAFGSSGSSLFGAKTQATSAFGTPNFGSTTPAFGGGTSTSGLFGSSNAGGSLFSQTTTQPSTGFSFGQAKSGNLFGTGTQQSSFFQTPQTSTAFGGQTTGGFGATPAAGTSATGLFGSSFGSTTTNPIGGGLFSASSAFGSTAPNGTTVKFNPVTSSESVNKSGTSISVQTKYQCISAMKEYETKSLEELRFEDYTAGRKSGTNSALFSSSTQQPVQHSSLFGSSTGSGFGQSKATTFGGFGQPTTTSSLFGQTSQSGSLFGSKPIGTGSIFGSTATTTNSGFGLGTSGNLFGQTTGPRFGSTGQSTGLFGATSGFGTTQTTSTGSGLFGTGTSTFGQPQTGSLFGATSKPFTLGAANSATSTFGANTLGATSGTGLFGSTAASKPAFSFNTSGTTGFGSTIGGFGASTSLGTGGGLFGANTGATTGTGLFGGQAKTGFGTGLGTSTGFGAGLGGTSAFGGIGGLGTSTGLTANQGVTGLAGINQASYAAFQQHQVLQQQLKALANSPFGDSPLFRNLTASRKRDEDISSSVPLSKAATASSHYKVFSKPSIKVKKKPSPFASSTKAKLFDDMSDYHGHEEASLTPRRSIKKLIIKQNPKGLLDKSVENSPLRLRSSLDDDDDDLISRIPIVPTASSESQSRIASVEESPVLQQAKKKVIITENPEASTNEADSTTESNGADENLSDSNDETENLCGVSLERSEYYTIPSIGDLNKMVTDDGKCLVDNFVVGREDYGEVKFLGTTDVKDLNLDEIVFFRRREAEVYPDNYPNKPEVGKELNKRSEISLHKVWPNDKTSRTPIKSPERLKKSGFIERLEEKTSAMGALFLDYKPGNGTWVFQVDHFTRYGLKEQLLEEAEEESLKKQKMDAKYKELSMITELKAKKKMAMLIDQKMDEMISNEDEVMQSKPMDSEPNWNDSYVNSAAVTLVEGNENADTSENDAAFSASVQAANISGVDPQRIQGMKALLFEDDDGADFLSPREKSVLTNRSLISGNMRQTQLIGRFDSPQTTRSEREKLNISLFSETVVPAESPSLTSNWKRLKSSFVEEEKGKAADLTSRPLFSSTKALSVDIEKQVQPQIRPTRNSCLAPFTLSSQDSKEHQICDAGLANGRRSRVGWAPKLRFANAGNAVGIETEHLKSETNKRDMMFRLSSRYTPLSSPSEFTVKLESIGIGDERTDHSFIVECLENTLRHSRVSCENGESPLIETVDGVDALHSFSEMTKKYGDFPGDINEADIRYQHSIVWDLIKALWGRLENADQKELSPYQSRIYRRHAVSKWLSKIAEQEIKQEIDNSESKDFGHLDAIFSLLSGKKIREACKIACDNREYRLSLLLSQACGDSQTRHLLQKQLDEWKTSAADKFMNVSMLKLYQLLSGLMVWMSSHGEINLCENFDWKRSLALHLWYFCPTTSSIAKALEEYSNAYKGTDSYSPYAPPPKPCYASDRCSVNEDDDNEAKTQPKDICYHILKLFSKRSHRLEKLLSPSTHTNDPLDYQLCWHLQQIFESLGYSHLSESQHCLIQASFASQLEIYGLWEWAIFVLLHIKGDKRREFAVRQMLFRHCKALENYQELTEKEKLLIGSMKIPSKWIYEAKAHHARYCSKPYDEAVYLLKAERWNAAHQIFMEKLAADVVIDGDYSFSRDFLIELSQPERSCTIKNWKQGGQVLLDFDLLREKLLMIETGDLVVTAYNLEDLRDDVTSLINMISMMKADSPKERLAQAEMGKTSSNLLKVVLSELAEQGLDISDDEEGEMAEKRSTLPMDKVAPFIATLPLPPDYVLQELGTIFG